MRRLFRAITALSLRLRLITLVLAVAVLALGGVAVGQLNQELLPPVEFPQTIVLTQVSGLTSEQALSILTERLEAELSTIPEIVNIESTTTGAIGSVLTLLNDFGVNRTKLLDDVQTTIDRVWLPLRSIAPEAGESANAFAARLLADLPPDVVLYLAQRDGNFLFQLNEQVWAAMPDETVRAALAYLANRTDADNLEKSALERLVEQEIVPQLSALPNIANIQISGGQTLPGEPVVTQLAGVDAETAPSLLLQLPPKVWTALAPRLSDLNVGALDQTAVEALAAQRFTLPIGIPALPDSWLRPGFSSAQDLYEVRSLTVTPAGVLNRFADSGRIVGALGTTEDLTPEIVAQMLAIEPGLTEYFNADQLAALPQDVFDILPADYIAGLDGFTRDALAAKALAQQITGEAAQVAPQPLPSQWRINPPQVLTFSFADLPLVSYTVYAPVGEDAVVVNPGGAADPASAPNAALLGQLVGLLTGSQTTEPDGSPLLGQEWDALAGQPQFAQRPLDSAADLIELGDGSASSVLNTINAAVPQAFAGYEIRLFNSLTPDVLAYLAANEPGFYANLDADVLRKLSREALASLPAGSLNDEALIAELEPIASGEAPSAFDAVSELYTSDAPPADPNAPALNESWAQVGGFLGVELDTADDFFRFFPDVAVWWNSFFETASGTGFAPNLFGNMTPTMMSYVMERDPELVSRLRMEALVLFPPDVQAQFPDEIQEQITEGGTPFVPAQTITRNKGASSLLVTVYKQGDANTVNAYYDAKAVIDKIQQENPQIVVNVGFEQSSFVEESISGVAREGVTGALFAMIVILLFLSGGRWPSSPRRAAGIVMFGGFALALLIVTFVKANETGLSLDAAFEQVDVVVRVLLIVGTAAGLIVLLWPGSLPIPAWRATLVIGVSLPLSVFAAFALMNWLPSSVHEWLEPLAAGSPFLSFVLRLFPESITLNIMTLSGLTVAVGRIVDDSIVVLENAFREIQSGGDKRQAVLKGTADVSSAIFVATLVTVVVFLPLGLTGGLIGEFFLPFGLAVTYSLLASFVVAITVVPVLMVMFISAHDAHEEERGILVRIYEPALKWALNSRATKWTVLAVAGATMVFGGVLFSTRPAAFLPELGEPQISVSVSMPQGTKILETDAKVRELEAFVISAVPEDELKSLQTTVGGGGMSLESFFGGGSISEHRASITIIAELSMSELEALTAEIKTEAVEIFGDENAEVSLGSISSSGFGGFSLVVYGPQDQLEAWDAQIIAAVEGVDGIEKVSSNLATAALAGSDAPQTFLRVDGQPALSYSGTLTTENTIGVTQQAIQAVREIPGVPDTLTVTQGYASRIQTEGFAGLFVAMLIAIVIVVIILVISMQSPVYWLAIILSVVVAPVGAAVALTLTNRVLGISALIGMLMLIGIVITNAVVLIDRVRQNVTHGMPMYDALVEAGERRLRPILMTALATIIALIPLAVGLSEGALIASELGTVVIGGLFSSTVLTLLVVPVAYSLLTPLHRTLTGRRSKEENAPAASPSSAD